MWGKTTDLVFRKPLHNNGNRYRFLHQPFHQTFPLNFDETTNSDCTPLNCLQRPFIERLTGYLAYFAGLQRIFLEHQIPSGFDE